MRIFGRILLAITGILLLVAGIGGLILTITALNAISWNVAGSSQDGQPFWVLIVGLVGFGADALFGFSAIGGCIRGRKSLGLGLAAIILMIAPTITLVTNIRNGVPFNWDTTWTYVSGYALPLMYFLGFLLI